MVEISESPKLNAISEWYTCPNATKEHPYTLNVLKNPFVSVEDFENILKYPRSQGFTIKETNINNEQGFLVMFANGDPRQLLFKKEGTIIDLKGGCDFTSNQLVEIAHSFK